MTPPTFDALTLAAVCGELQRTLVGARVQRVQQPEGSELVLSLYGGAGAHRLRIAADPAAPRVHLTQQKRDNPVQPPGFCQVARKDLEGAWLESASMPALDRVLHLSFVAADGSAATLILELMGRNANVFLLDADRRIRGSLRSETGVRALTHGVKYSPPPGLGEGGASAFLRAELDARGMSEPQELLALPFAPHTVMDPNGRTVGVWAFEPLCVAPGLRFPRESISVALDTFYALRQSDSAEKSERSSLGRAIRRESDYRKKALADSRRTIEEASRADMHEQNGQLLLGHLSQLAKGQSEVTLPDWFASGERTIPLDPKKTPQENAESCFARARKVRDAAEWADGRIADLEDELNCIASNRC